MTLIRNYVKSQKAEFPENAFVRSRLMKGPESGGQLFRLEVNDRPDALRRQENVLDWIVEEATPGELT